MRSHDQIVIVDGYSFVFRAYHAMPPLTRPSDGLPVGAVYGFTSMLLKLLLDMQPEQLVVVFDTGKKTHRNEIYPEYKAHRPPVPQDLIPQFPLVKEAASAFNIKILEKEGFEADDVIATLARMAKAENHTALIVSSDKDLTQLVDDKIKMYDALKLKVIGEEEVKAKYGVLPSQMRDFLALVGDASDNVPGVPGVGIKTAAELLNTYKSIEGILEHLNEIKQPKRRESFINNREQLALSMRLISLEYNVPLEVDLDELKVKKINAQNLVSFLSKQGFQSLLARVRNQLNIREDLIEEPFEAEFSATSTPMHGTVISLETDLKRVLADVAVEGKVALYLQNNFETNIEIKELKDIHSIGLAFGTKTYCIKIGENGIDINVLVPELLKLLQNVSIKKILYDYKLMLHLLNSAKRSTYFNGVEDIMIMSYALGGGRNINSCEQLLKFYLEKIDSIQEIGGITKIREQFLALDINTNIYIEEKTHAILNVYTKLSELLFENKKQTLYQKFDRPLSEIVYNMEKAGIKLDKHAIEKLSADISSEIKTLSIEIYKIAGSEFNIASPKQLAEVLFTKMKLPYPKKSKGNEYSTDIDTLEQLQLQGHTIADLLIKWRQLNKLKTSYTDSLVAQINENTGRIHTTFSLAYTLTGRFSSNEPNLQNIPIRGTYGTLIRSAFIAADGYKILSADYSQIELRILAHIADVKALKAAFQNETIDIHTITASEIFNVPIDKVTQDLRHTAKIINFGITYGMREHSLAKNLGITRHDAANYIRRYFEKYPEVSTYMERTKEFVTKHGYVETLAGRRCYINEINSQDNKIKLFAERAAINAPIQGSNADIIRRAMVTIHDKVLSKTDDVTMLLQVHDELLFEIKDNHNLEQHVSDIKHAMENSMLLDVPLKVNCTTGCAWKEKK